MDTFRWLAAFTILAFFALFLLATPPPRAAHAAGPWYVSTAAGASDSKDCLTSSTPCASINGALTKPGFSDGDTIKVASGTYYGTGNEVVLLNRSATISGGWDTAFASQSGMSTIDGQGARRGVVVSDGIAASIGRSSIQNGKSFWGAGISNHGTLTASLITVISNTVTASWGGGIYNYNGASVVISESLISNNDSNWHGGGIYNEGTMTISTSRVTNNLAGGDGSGGGGGAGINNLGTLRLVQSTVDSNRLRGSFFGGGIISYGSLAVNNSTVSNNMGGDGIVSFGSVTISSSTIAGNSGYGLALWGGGTARIQNSIFANNGDKDCSLPDFYGTFINSGHNLIKNNSGCTLAEADQSGVDPFLGSLQDNGGSTPTQAISISLATNRGNPGGCKDEIGNFLNTDQRGMARVGRCDIGAFEYQGEIYYTHLPLSTAYRVPLGIYGRVTVNGSDASGVPLELRFYNGSAWSTAATTNTGADGKYSFLTAPSLGPGQRYYVRYLNSSNSNRVSAWLTRVITSYTAGSNVAIGDFDVANVPQQSPSAGATVSLPYTSQWGMRGATPTDSYEFNLFDNNNQSTYWYTPPLGYVNSYTLNSLPPGFNPGTRYYWYMGVYSPDGGYGQSYYAYAVTFSNSGSSPLRVAPLQPRNSPAFQDGKRLPRLQPAR